MNSRRPDVPPEARRLSRGQSRAFVRSSCCCRISTASCAASAAAEGAGRADREGMSFPASASCWTAAASLIEGLAHGSDDGDPDYLCRLVPGSCARVPWSKTPLAQCLSPWTSATAVPTSPTPPGAGRRTGALCGTGLTPVIAVEYEFYLLDDTRGEAPRAAHGACRAQPRRRPARLQPRGPARARRRFRAITQPRSAGHAGRRDSFRVRRRPVRGQSASRARCAGRLRPRRTAAPARAWRCAGTKGLAATFMAKPFADLDGSGMHVHFSLVDKSGAATSSVPAIRRRAPEAYAALLRHAIGGMLAAMPESLAIFCPNANSYRRIRPGLLCADRAELGAESPAVASASRSPTTPTSASSTGRPARTAIPTSRWRRSSRLPMTGSRGGSSRRPWCGKARR